MCYEWATSSNQIVTLRACQRFLIRASGADQAWPLFQDLYYMWRSRTCEKEALGPLAEPPYWPFMPTRAPSQNSLIRSHEWTKGCISTGLEVERAIYTEPFLYPSCFLSLVFSNIQWLPLCCSLSSRRHTPCTFTYVLPRTYLVPMPQPSPWYTKLLSSKENYLLI